MNGNNLSCQYLSSKIKKNDGYIKQNQTDIEKMKKHIVKNWGEAVKQLDNTQKARKMKNPIKIILIYEDYYKSECLDELF